MIVRDLTRRHIISYFLAFQTRADWKWSFGSNKQLRTRLALNRTLALWNEFRHSLSLASIVKNNPGLSGINHKTTFSKYTWFWFCYAPQKVPCYLLLVRRSSLSLRTGTLVKMFARDRPEQGSSPRQVSFTILFYVPWQILLVNVNQ